MIIPNFGGKLYSSFDDEGSLWMCGHARLFLHHKWAKNIPYIILSIWSFQLIELYPQHCLPKLCNVLSVLQMENKAMLPIYASMFSAYVQFAYFSRLRKTLIKIQLLWHKPGHLQLRQNKTKCILFSYTMMPNFPLNKYWLYIVFCITGLHFAMSVPLDEMVDEVLDSFFQLRFLQWNWVTLISNLHNQLP